MHENSETSSWFRFFMSVSSRVVYKPVAAAVEVLGEDIFRDWVTAFSGTRPKTRPTVGKDSVYTCKPRPSFSCAYSYLTA